MNKKTGFLLVVFWMLSCAVQVGIGADLKFEYHLLVLLLVLIMKHLVSEAIKKIPLAMVMPEFKKAKTAVVAIFTYSRFGIH